MARETADTVTLDIREKAMLLFQCPLTEVEVLHVANVLVVCNLHREPVQRMALDVAGNRFERLLAVRAALDSIIETRRL